MMLLNLKSTRHLLTTPNMQAENTKEPWSSRENSPTGSLTGWGAHLRAQPRHLMEEHIRLDYSGVHLFLASVSLEGGKILHWS